MPRKKLIVSPVAKAGLIAKGIVYCLIGILAFMAAFHIGGQSAKATDRTAVFDFLQKQDGGEIMLAVLALGLICYTLWRFFQAATNPGDDSNKPNTGKRIRYFFSGGVYGLFAYQIVKKLFSSGSGSQDSSKDAVGELLSKPAGQIMVGIVALALLGVGLYQIYYGLSEKYKKHVDKSIASKHRPLLLIFGKIGYISRGVVWLILSFLLFKAAVHSNANEAGDTSKAFEFLSDSPYGAYLLAAVALGLICYGTFNFVRARFENIRTE